MKISEVKVGKEYALTASAYNDPRHVKAVEVVTIPEKTWDRVTEQWHERQVRFVKVKFLDKPGRRYGEAKGSTKTVQARLLVPWEKIGPKLRQRAEMHAKADALQTELERRVKKVLGRGYDGYITVRENGYVNLDLRGRSVTKMIELAEKGVKSNG